MDEYFGWMFENSVPGLPEKAAKEELTPLAYMRRYGAFEIKKKVGQIYEERIRVEELEDVSADRFGRVYTMTPKRENPNVVPVPTPDGDLYGRRFVGVKVDGKIKRGFPTPSGKLEFYST